MEEVKVDLPQDLNAHVQTIRAFALTHNVLVQGTYKPQDFQAVHDCVEFIKSLHGEALKVASRHKDSDLVPELKAFKESIVDEAPNASV